MKGLCVASRKSLWVQQPTRFKCLTDHGAKGRFRHQRTCDEDLAGEFQKDRGYAACSPDLELITRLTAWKRQESIDMK